MLMQLCIHNRNPPSQALHDCFKWLRQMIKHLMRHARNIRRLKYGKALLRMFVKTPNVALKSIMRTAMGTSPQHILLTNLSIIKDKTTGLLLTTPSTVLRAISELETVALTPDPTLPPGVPFPWIGLVGPTPTASVPLISVKISEAIMYEALRRTPNHKAAGPDGVPGLVLKHMNQQFHEALHLLLHDLAITLITSPSWLQSHIILLYKKGDPTNLDTYRPITSANAIYKLCTTCIVILATDYIKSRKILSPEQEVFRADRSCARAVTRLSLCVKDAHTSKKDIILCYPDFKGAFPSTD